MAMQLRWAIIMKIAVATLLLVLMSNAYAFDESGRAAWISKRVLQLREVQDVKKIPLAGFAKSNDEKNKQGLYRYYAKRNGRVDFKDGTWVIFTSHSAHSEEGRREVIGDVTVARTSSPIVK